MAAQEGERLVKLVGNDIIIYGNCRICGDTGQRRYMAAVKTRPDEDWFVVCEEECLNQVPGEEYATKVEWREDPPCMAPLCDRQSIVWLARDERYNGSGYRAVCSDRCAFYLMQDDCPLEEWRRMREKEDEHYTKLLHPTK